MPTLKSSSSRQSQFVDYQQVPSYAAQADAGIVLAAYLDGLTSLLSLCSQDISEEVLLQGMYESLAAFAAIRDDIDDELMRADVTLDAIRAKLLL